MNPDYNTRMTANTTKYFTHSVYFLMTKWKMRNSLFIFLIYLTAKDPSGLCRPWNRTLYPKNDWNLQSCKHTVIKVNSLHITWQLSPTFCLLRYCRNVASECSHCSLNSNDLSTWYKHRWHISAGRPSPANTWKKREHDQYYLPYITNNTSLKLQSTVTWCHIVLHILLGYINFLAGEGKY